MTTVLQFHAASTDALQAAGSDLLAIINAASLLKARHEEGGVTQPLDASIVHQHTTDPTLWWMDWSAIYTAALTDAGRQIADVLVGAMKADGTWEPGLNIGPALGTSGVVLEVALVPDLVAAGYVAAPVTIG